MSEQSAPDSEPDDTFDRYVAFHTSAGARWEINTCIAGSLLSVVGFPAAGLCWLFGATGILAGGCYSVAGLGALLFLIHLFLYFYRRNAWW